MNFTHKQKKYLKKHLKKDSLGQVSSVLKVSESEIKEYLKRVWNKKKYEKFLAKQAKTIGAKHSSKNKTSFRSWFSKNRWHILFLVALIIITYANSINNAFLSDDINGIVNNTNLDNIKSVFSNRFAFFHVFIYYVINHFWGRSPAAFRLVTIFFHLGTVLSLYFLLSLLFSSRVGFLTALLFSVHPLLCESVVWISAGYTVYSAFWILISFSFYVLAIRKKSTNRYWLSVFFYFLALGSSEKVLTFPIVLTLYQISAKEFKKNWKKLIPFFILSFIWGIYLLGSFSGRAASLQKNFYQQAPRVNTPAQFITTTFNNTAVAVDSYLGLIAWPRNLTLYHSEMHFSRAEYTIMVFAFLVYLTTIIYFYFRNKKVSFWLLFFIVMLSPTLTPYGVSWIVAERYAYLASIGIFVIIATGLNEIIRNKKLKVPGMILIGLITVLLSWRTIRRNYDWKNQDNLWLAAAKISHSSSQNHNNLGDLYARRGNYQKAIEEFQAAIKLNHNYGDAYHNLANIYWRTKQVKKAIENYQKALEINPRLWQSHQNLAVIFFHQGDYSSAEKHLKMAIKINRKNANLYANLAIVLAKRGKAKEAEAALETAAKLEPNNPQIQKFLEEIKNKMIKSKP